MYKQCVNEESAARQQQIAQTYLTLIEKKGFDSVGISELCQAVPIPRRAFYRYFDTREDVLDFLFDELFHKSQQFGSFTQFGSEAALKQTLAARLRFYQEQGGQLLVALKQNDLLDREIKRAMERQIEHPELFRDATATRLYLIEYMATSLGFHTAATWLQYGCQGAPETVADLLYGLLTKPLLPDSF